MPKCVCMPRHNSRHGVYNINEIVWFIFRFITDQHFQRIEIMNQNNRLCSRYHFIWYILYDDFMEPRSWTGIAGVTCDLGRETGYTYCVVYTFRTAYRKGGLCLCGQVSVNIHWKLRVFVIPTLYRGCHFDWQSWQHDNFRFSESISMFVVDVSRSLLSLPS